MKEHAPDPVILDIVMAGLDGLQVIGLIRQRSSAPVIMLTGVTEVTTCVMHWHKASMTTTLYGVLLLISVTSFISGL